MKVSFDEVKNTVFNQMEESKPVALRFDAEKLEARKNSIHSLVDLAIYAEDDITSGLFYILDCLTEDYDLKQKDLHTILSYTEG